MVVVLVGGTLTVEICSHWSRGPDFREPSYSRAIAYATHNNGAGKSLNNAKALGFHDKLDYPAMKPTKASEHENALTINSGIIEVNSLGKPFCSGP
ncbi:hypothetical protein NC653_024053 [Populus alba x Populus x berolinensis]|uniref:Uncharacterized protein n=1 Tax=Populus alba x Populus x berolinensis TaxID=444605 RepID=A0AAD6MJG1_9ROSI|nr:hypothetical protein NC653_024053 [Populus alba x Populus x berolinensis]